MPNYQPASDASQDAEDLEYEAYMDAMDEGPTCSICDAVGHGYPGGGPCPLEERGYWDARQDEERMGF